MKNKNIARPYVGVYGLMVKDKAILMIRKARGPYRGLYDLPGGRLEFGEKLIDGLTREIYEETGGRLIKAE